MGLTIIDNNKDYQASLSPVGLKLQTNSHQINAGDYYVGTLEITASPYPVLGNYLTFTWNNELETVVFDIASTLDDAGTVIRPNTGGLSISAYTLQVMSDIKRNYRMNTFFSFSITGPSSSIIRITAKNKGSMYNVIPASWAVLFSSFFFDAATTAGVDEVYNENFSAIVEVHMERVKNSGTYELIGKLESYPFNNICKFDLSSILNSELKTNIPNIIISGQERCDDSLKRYFIKYYEKYGTPASEKVIVESPDTAYILKAGIKYLDWNPTNQKIIDTIKTGINFLTNQEHSKKIRKDQPEFIAWICPIHFDDVVWQIRLSVSLFYSDGTESYHVKNGSFISSIFRPYDVLRYSTGYNQLEIDTIKTSGKTVDRYIVTIIAQSNTTNYGALSNDFEYQVSTDVEHDINFYIFANALGDFDTLCCTGELAETIELTKDIAEKYYDYEHKTSDFSSINYHNTSKQIKKQSTGFKSKTDIDYLEELFLSTEVYHVKEGKLIPINITQKSYEKYKSKQFVNGFDFEYCYAFKEEV